MHQETCGPFPDASVARALNFRRHPAFRRATPVRRARGPLVIVAVLFPHYRTTCTISRSAQRTCGRRGRAHPGRDVRRRPERPRTVEQFPRADTPGALRDAGRPGPPRPTTVCCCLFVAGPSRGPVRKKGALCPSLWEPLGSGGKVGVRIVRIVSSWRMRPCPSPFLCAARRLASPLPQLCQLRRPPQRVHGRPPEKVHRRCFLM